MSKSNKFDSAAARARNASSPHEGVIDEPGTSLATLGDAEVKAAVQSFDAGALAALVAAGAVKMGPRLLTLEAGQMIIGRIESEGIATIEDENTKLPKEIRTWQIALCDREQKPTGVRVSILSSAQLDREIPPVHKSGNAAIICRGGEIQIKGGKRRMTEYFVLEVQPGTVIPAGVGA